jgi:hypothetical protein
MESNVRMVSILEVWIDSFNEKVTFLWLSRGDLKGETESEITAALDVALQTNSKRQKITNRNR